jgi:murein DD-endopeptidase MepM/ murein hydrolase activator NlpD
VRDARVDALLGDVWIHPLQGPTRRMPVRDSRLFGAERLGDRPSECRGGHCGVDLAGAYGEAVLAAHDGVIDRIQRELNPEHGGRYVRISHRDGTVITEYFHLSQIPRRLDVGLPVKAGDVVGWVGLSGVKRSEPHLHFTVSVQDPATGEGRYIDPEPLVALWPLRLPGPSAEPLQLMTSAPAGLARGVIRRRHRHSRPSEAPIGD